MLDRRALLVAFGGVGGFVAGLPRLAQASDETGVFWKVQARGTGGVLFGYQRVAAQAVPDMLADGERLLANVNAVCVDHGNVQKTITVPNQTLKPLLPSLQGDLAAQLRTIVAALGVPANQIDTAPSALVLMAIVGEGAPPAQVTVGGTLFERAQALGKPASALMTPAETEEFWKMLGPGTQLTELQLSNDAVKALLAIRHEVGPIGAHCVALYRARKIDALHRFSQRLESQGIPPLIWQDPHAAAQFYLDIVAPRIAQKLGVPTLFFVNGGTFLIEHGLLARLREQGATVTAIA